MLLHAPIRTDDPRRIAALLGGAWKGPAYPFPAFPGSFVALPGDERGTALEIYPLDWEEADDADAAGDPSAPRPVIGVLCREAEFHRSAARAGWSTRAALGMEHFRVVALWVENRLFAESEEVLPAALKAKGPGECERWAVAADGAIPAMAGF
jgi:hypothetical protein